MLTVVPSLERVDVLVEVGDSGTVIPRNSVIEANQSGLIAEPLVDITPQLPIPAFIAGPLEAGCEEEGALVCANGRIAGRQVRTAAFPYWDANNTEAPCFATDC